MPDQDDDNFNPNTVQTEMVPASNAVLLQESLQLEHDLVKSGRRFIIAVPQNPKFTAAVKTDIATDELKGYDGCVIDWKATDLVQGYVSGSINNLTSSPLYWPGFAQTLSDLQTTNFRKWQHNFLKATLQTSGTLGSPPLDGFSPQIEVFIHNRRMMARLAAEGFLDGIWDNLEPTNGTAGYKWFNYSDRPLADPDLPGYKTFQEYKDRYFYIGRRVAEVYQEEFSEMIWVPTFLWEQARAEESTAEELRNYGLLPSYLNGFFSVFKAPGQVHSYYEDGYNRTGEFGYAQRHQQERFINSNGVDYSADVSERYNGFTGNSTMVDTPPSAVFDTVTDTNNYFTGPLFQQAIEVGALITSDKFQFVYAEDTNPLTLPTVYDNALNAARITIGIDFLTDPTLNPNIIFHSRPLSLTGMVDTAAISSVTDLLGNVGTSSGGLRPTWSANAFGTGIPGIHYASASSQKLIWDAVAALFQTGTVQDKAGFAIAAINPVSVTAGTAAILSFGRSATNTPILSLKVNTTSDLATQRQDNAGSSANVPAVADTTHITLAKHVVGVIWTGIGASLYVDNTLLIAAPLSQDVGVMTLDQFTTGATRSNAVLTNFFNGDHGTVIVGKGAPGVEEFKALCRIVALDHVITVA